jgi:cytoskeletal protein CcmA (bactofilin family)
MFSKVNKTMAQTPETAKPAPKNMAPTIISGDLRITGDVVGSGDIQVDGIIEGDVHGRSITIGEGAEVRGSLSADTVRVYGTVSGGTIKATTVSVAKTARILSNIMHQTLSIESGAYVEGDMKRMEGVDPKMALVGEKGFAMPFPPPSAPTNSVAPALQPIPGMQTVGRK